MNQIDLDFDGSTYEKNLDHERLFTLLDKVRILMEDGKWRTLRDIQDRVGGSEAGVSARLRDLRKLKFGEYQVNRRRRGNPKGGIFEYQVLMGRPT